MDDAYTIGITLALENGVSEGLAIIQRDLDALNLAVSHTMSGLAGLRRAADTAITGAGVDLGRLTAEGQRLLGRLPSLAVPPPAARSHQSGQDAEQPASLAAGTPMPGPAPVSAPARSAVHDRAAPEAPATVPRPAKPIASVTPMASALSASAIAPAAPVASASTRSIVPVMPVATAPAGSIAPVAPVASAATERMVPPQGAFAGSGMPPPLRVVLPPASAAPVPSAAMPLARVNVVPTAVQRSESIAAPITPPARGLAASDLAALGRSLAPAPVQLSTPAPAQLATFGASAMPLQAPAPAAPKHDAGSAADRWPELPRPSARPVSERRIDTAPSGTPIRSMAPSAMPSHAASLTAVAPPGGAMLPSAAPRDRAQGAMRVEGAVFLDGHLVGRWLAEHLAHEAGRAPAGPTGFDARAGIVWPGAPIQP